MGSQGDDRKPLLIKASHLPSGSLGSKFPESWAGPSACLLAFFFEKEQKRRDSQVCPGEAAHKEEGG